MALLPLQAPKERKSQARFDAARRHPKVALCFPTSDTFVSSFVLVTFSHRLDLAFTIARALDDWATVDIIIDRNGG